MLPESDVSADQVVVHAIADNDHVWMKPKAPCLQQLHFLFRVVPSDPCVDDLDATTSIAARFCKDRFQLFGPGFRRELRPSKRNGVAHGNDSVDTSFFLLGKLSIAKSRGIRDERLLETRDEDRRIGTQLVDHS